MQASMRARSMTLRNVRCDMTACPEGLEN